MASYSSNCPVSRPAQLDVKEDADFGGLSWSNKQGLFFASENPLLPIKKPTPLSFAPNVR